MILSIFQFNTAFNIASAGQFYALHCFIAVVCISLFTFSSLFCRFSILHLVLFGFLVQFCFSVWGIKCKFWNAQLPIWLCFSCNFFFCSGVLATCRYSIIETFKSSLKNYLISIGTIHTTHIAVKMYALIVSKTLEYAISNEKFCEHIPLQSKCSCSLMCELNCEQIEWA